MSQKDKLIMALLSVGPNEYKKVFYCATGHPLENVMSMFELWIFLIDQDVID